MRRSSFSLWLSVTYAPIPGGIRGCPPRGWQRNRTTTGQKLQKIWGPPLWKAPPFTPWISWSIREYPGAKVVIYFGITIGSRWNDSSWRSRIYISISPLIFRPVLRISRSLMAASQDTEKVTLCFLYGGSRHFRPAPGLAPPRLISVVCIFHPLFKSVLRVKYLHSAAIAVRSASHRDMQVRSIISAPLAAVPVGVVLASHPVLHPLQGFTR